MKVEEVEALLPYLTEAERKEWVHEKLKGSRKETSEEGVFDIRGDAGTVLGMIYISDRLGLPAPKKIRELCQDEDHVRDLIEGGQFTDMQTELKAVEISLSQLAIEVLEKRLQPEPDWDDLSSKMKSKFGEDVVDDARKTYTRRPEFQAIVDKARHGFVDEAAAKLATIIDFDYQGSEKSQTDEMLAFTLLSMATYYKGLTRTLNQSLASYIQSFVNDDASVCESHDYQVEPGDLIIAGSRSASPEGTIETMLKKELEGVQDAHVIRRGNRIIVTDNVNPETGASETTYQKWRIGQRQSASFTKENLEDPRVQQMQKNAMGAPTDMPLYGRGLSLLRQVRATKGFDESQDRKFDDVVLSMRGGVRKRMFELTDGNGFGFEGRSRGEAPSP